MGKAQYPRVKASQGFYCSGFIHPTNKQRNPNKCYYSSFINKTNKQTKDRLCLCPCVITPRGFTSLQTQEYSFPGFIPTNKQTNRQTNMCQYFFKGLAATHLLEVTEIRVLVSHNLSLFTLSFKNTSNDLQSVDEAQAYKHTRFCIQSIQAS